MSAASRFPLTGAARAVTDVGSGMRWTALMSQTSGLDAYGEDAFPLLAADQPGAESKIFLSN